jgi:hypothetical protein
VTPLTSEKHTRYAYMYIQNNFTPFAHTQCSTLQRVSDKVSAIADGRHQVWLSVHSSVTLTDALDLDGGQLGASQRYAHDRIDQRVLRARDEEKQRQTYINCVKYGNKQWPV